MGAGQVFRIRSPYCLVRIQFSDRQAARVLGWLQCCSPCSCLPCPALHSSQLIRPVLPLQAEAAQPRLRRLTAARHPAWRPAFPEAAGHQLARECKHLPAHPATQLGRIPRCAALAAAAHPAAANRRAAAAPMVPRLCPPPVAVAQHRGCGWRGRTRPGFLPGAGRHFSRPAAADAARRMGSGVPGPAALGDQLPAPRGHAASGMGGRRLPCAGNHVRGCETEMCAAAMYADWLLAAYAGWLKHSVGVSPCCLLHVCVLENGTLLPLTVGVPALTRAFGLLLCLTPSVRCKAGLRSTTSAARCRCTSSQPIPASLHWR